MNPKRDLKIKLLRERGKTYDEIAKALHVGRSTISKVLGMESTESRTGRSGTVVPASFFNGESSYIRKNVPIENGNVLGSSESNTLGSTENTTLINKKRTKFMAGPEGLWLAPIDNSGRFSNSHSIMGIPLLSWFWKIFFLAIGIVLLIKILKKIKGQDEDNL